jgi:hypothetical protein
VTLVCLGAIVVGYEDGVDGHVRSVRMISSQHAFNNVSSTHKIHIYTHLSMPPTQTDKEVDGGLPLEQVLKPDQEVRAMIQGLKMKKWVFTNAGIEVCSTKCEFARERVGEDEEDGA